MSETGTIEECVEDIDDFLATLGHYPPAALAIALRAHLAGLLQVMRERGDWSDEHIRDFLQDLANEIEESGGD